MLRKSLLTLSSSVKPPLLSKPLASLSFGVDAIYEGTVEGTMPFGGVGIAVGQFLEVKRKFCPSTVGTFVKLTGDTNPIHSEEKKGSMIVPGLLLASTFPSLLSCIFPNCIYRTQKLKFASPVRCDQEVLARIDVTTVKSLNVPTKVVSEDGGYTREKALIISFQTSILRVQDGICVLAGDGEVVFKGGMDIGELVEKQAGEDDIK